MATVVTRYLNTASTAGGDGTTNATAGANRAYHTLSAALAAIATEFANFVTSDVQVDLLCEGGADTATVTTPAITTDATRFLRVKANTGQEALPTGWSTSRYRLSCNTTPLNMGTNIKFMRVEGLQIECTNNTANSNQRGIILAPGAGSSTQIISECRIRWSGTGATSGHAGIFILSGSGSNNTKIGIVNCIVEDWSFTGSAGINCQIGTGGADNIVFCYHTLTYNCTVGFQKNAGFQSGPMTKNSVAAACATGWVASTGFAPGTDFNASDQATVPGSNSIASQTFAFTNAGAGDYTLTDSDPMVAAGTSLISDSIWPVTLDIAGASRTVPISIGPVEHDIAGGGGSAVPVIVHHLRQQGIC